jgi:hypothetical protein
MTIEKIWFWKPETPDDFIVVWEKWVKSITSEIEEVGNGDFNVARIWVHKEDWKIISFNIDDCVIVYK